MVLVGAVMPLQWSGKQWTGRRWPVGINPTPVSGTWTLPTHPFHLNGTKPEILHFLDAVLSIIWHEVWFRRKLDKYGKRYMKPRHFLFVMMFVLKWFLSANGRWLRKHQLRHLSANSIILINECIDSRLWAKNRVWTNLCRTYHNFYVDKLGIR